MLPTPLLIVIVSALSTCQNKIVDSLGEIVDVATEKSFVTGGLTAQANEKGTIHKVIVFGIFSLCHYPLQFISVLIILS
jgi:hypothetical protein